MADRPWFIRLGANLQPCSAPGWIATAVFTAGALGLGTLHRQFEHGRNGLAVWVTLLALWTATFVVVAYRNSERGEVLLDRDKRMTSRSRGKRF